MPGTPRQKALGLKKVPTLYVHGLSDELIRAFVLADNKFSDRAGWNREILAGELEKLSILLPAIDLDISLTGFEVGEIDVLLADIGEEKPEPEDRSPRPPVICMDWRHIEILMRVGREIYGSTLNLVVWNKTTPGQGSFYRSQHELIGVFRVGEPPHQNNVELGRTDAIGAMSGPTPA